MKENNVDLIEGAGSYESPQLSARINEDYDILMGHFLPCLELWN